MPLQYHCVVDVRPLTAEEISQRRQALKQRLAEKKERISGDADNAADTLSNGTLKIVAVTCNS